VRPSCTALELDSIPALQRIKADSRLTSGLRKIRLPSGHGDQEQQCLASTAYAWWLALIDPRRFKPERRPVLEERQQLRTIIGKPAPTVPQSARADAHGQMEGTFHCLRCGAPHLLVIDGAGWHLHLGVEVE
jgi:P22_AR N-terminal domain